MATILNFKPTEAASRGEPAAAAIRTCEIIIFPGIRYERWDETSPSAPQPVETRKKARAKKRDCLVLPD